MGKKYITEKEFVAVSAYLFSPHFEDKLKIVFDLLDFNNDSKIEPSDVHTLISHIPLQKMAEEKEESESKYNIKLNLNNIKPEDRLQSLGEIDQLIECLFKEREYITFEQFKGITENESSDLFISVYFLLRKQIPFYKQIPLYATEVKRVKTTTKKKPVCRKISSPKVLQQFSTVGRVIRKSSHRRSGVESGDQPNITEAQTPGNQTRESEQNLLETLTHYHKKTSSFSAAKNFVEQLETPVPTKKSHFFKEASQKPIAWVIDNHKGAETVVF